MNAHKDRFWIVLGLAVAGFGMIMFTISDLEGDRDNNDRDGMLCILQELAEHRVNSYDADRDAAVAENRPFNVPREAPMIDDRLAGACERFLGE